MRLTWLWLLFTPVLLFGQTKTETGTLGNASFRIDIPSNWNGGLVVFCHAYEFLPVVYDKSDLDATLHVFVSKGYAVAQSGYSSGGWAVREGIHDTEMLRRYFIREHGIPKKTYVAGMSLGSLISVAIMETEPDAFQAGLALCGPLAPTEEFMARRIFDLLIVFDYYLPGLLPRLDRIPEDFSPTPEIFREISQKLQSHPEKARELVQFAGLRNNQELINTIGFFSMILKEVEKRSGGNPFDNREVVYKGTSNDAGLNKGAKRYAADRKAMLYLKKYYTPTGHLSAPLLSLQTAYDPLMPDWVKSEYFKIVRKSGESKFFFQETVPGNGHCDIMPSDVDRALVALENWQRAGKSPASVASQAAR